MPRYKKCPRCELNYILEDKEYCDVCEQELKGIDTSIDEEEALLCPKCKQNYLEPGETLCADCMRLKAMGETDDNDGGIIDGDRITSLAELEEKEWEDEDESFDDEEGFGNEGDFLDDDIAEIDEDYDEPFKLDEEEETAEEEQDEEDDFPDFDDFDDLDALDDEDFDDEDLDEELDDLDEEL